MMGPGVVRIDCAKCEKQVDRVRVERDESTRRLYYKVWCHGDTDICFVDDIFIVENGMPRHGMAFTTERLNGPEVNTRPDRSIGEGQSVRALDDKRPKV